jgi:ATP-dependent exoDNAse (exonuclease V) alpha subunit
MSTEKTLSEDQQAAFDGIRRWVGSKPHGQAASLAGYAGCGKTFLVSMLAKEWQESGIDVLFVSPTGKASLVLRKQMADAGVHADVMTIHSTIYNPPTETKQGLQWSRHGRAIRAPIVVIDEASMVTADLWRDLQVACEGAIFLAVGDHGQLPAVGESARLMEDATWRLEKIHRQAADNPVIEFGRLVREVGVQQALAFATQSTDPRLQVRKIKTRADSEDVCRWAYDMPDWTDGMIIVSTNAERAKVNKIARRALGLAEAGPVAGDLAICLRNHHTAGLINGHRAMLASVVDRGGGMLTTSLHHSPVPRDQWGAERTLSTAEAPRSCLLLDYGYALTGHKAQGSQALRAVVSLEGVGWLARKGELVRWLYTAATRAADSLLLVS